MKVSKNSHKARKNATEPRLGAYIGEKPEAGDLVLIKSRRALAQVQSIGTDPLTTADMIVIELLADCVTGNAIVDMDRIPLTEDVSIVRALSMACQNAPQPVSLAEFYSVSFPIDRRNYFSEADQFERPVLANMNENHPIRVILEQVIELSNDEPKIEAPAFQALCRGIVEQIYSLPADQLRPLLNGWKPCPKRPTGETVLEMRREPSNLVRRYFSLDGNDAKGRGSKTASHRWIDDESNNEVEVRVFEYASREVVLKQLRKIVANIEKHWNTLVDAEPCMVKNYNPREEYPLE